MCIRDSTEAVEMDVDIHHGALREAQVVTLAASEIHAHNTFAQPEVVTLSSPVTVTAKSGENLRVSLPAGSVVRVQGKLEG